MLFVCSTEERKSYMFGMGEQMTKCKFPFKFQVHQKVFAQFSLYNFITMTIKLLVFILTMFIDVGGQDGGPVSITFYIPIQNYHHYSIRRPQFK